jgi:hypothetical protein|tara:strand:+ start:103 stop:510 length:408 start_codon:yes stop_codon:yes gene_type:complete
VKKRVRWKKVAVFGVTSLFTVLLLGVTFLVAQEQTEVSQYLGGVRLVDVSFPEQVQGGSFPIRYELSEERLPGVRGLQSFINGTEVVVVDDEGVFDGKTIQWIVHARNKGVVAFNVSLYHQGRLLDLQTFQVTVV